MTKLAAVLVVAISIAAATVASAASLPSTSNRVGSGGAAVTTCGSTTAAVVGYTQSAGNVTHVAVSGLPSTCNGGALTVTLTQNGVSRATGPAQTVVSGAATITLSSTPAASTVTDSRILIVGP